MRDYLRNLRISRNYTQRYVAEGLGISQQYYGQIEHGLRQIPMKMDILTALSEFYCLSAEWFIKNEVKFFEEKDL